MQPQAEAAQRVYNARASSYEDSWHPDYSRRLMGLVPIKAGDRVLVPCCGTGLESFIAAEAVGSYGLVVGVDITQGMLAEAETRQNQDVELGPRIKFVRHDVTDLDSCLDIKNMKGTFDLLVCSNAFVLFDRPEEVVRQWKGWLKNGGRMVIDITHEKNLIQGIVIENVAEQMQLRWFSNRRWITGRESFKKILESEGMQVEKVHFIDKVAGLPNTYYGDDEADEQFDYITRSAFNNHQWEEKDRGRARELFRKEWEALAVDGKVDVVDGLYLYIAKKP